MNPPSFEAVPIVSANDLITDTPDSPGVLPVPARVVEGRTSIESLLDEVNRVSPNVGRRLTSWGRSAVDSMSIAAVPLSDAGRPGIDLFAVEARFSYGLESVNRDFGAPTASYSVLLPLSGAAHMQMTEGGFVVQAGEGLIIDPARVEKMTLEAGTHFLEFDLPRSLMLGLNADLSQGGGGLSLASVLKPGLPARLLAMAREAAGVLHTDRQSRAGQLLFQRWMELIGLTVLNEQALAAPVLARPATRVSSAASLRRALDFIEANAECDLMLADIASAACASVSTLLRLFNEHLQQSPASYLRDVRLDRARAELRGGSAGTVREVAQRWGFQNASKFSQAFARRFGEQPSETRARFR